MRQIKKLFKALTTNISLIFGLIMMLYIIIIGGAFFPIIDFLANFAFTLPLAFYFTLLALTVYYRKEVKRFTANNPSVLVIYRLIIIVFLCIAFLPTVIGNLHFTIDLFAHFQLQYLIIAIYLIVFSIIVNAKDSLLLLTVYVIFASILVFPLTFRSSESITDPDIFFMNILYVNQDYEEISDYILERQPETVGITESIPAFEEILSEEYGEPVLTAQLRDEGLGDAQRCAIFTKKEVLDAYVLDETLQPICVVEFEDYHMVLIHPAPGYTEYTAHQQKINFERTALFLHELIQEDKEFVLVGDFNSTFYSPIFRTNFIPWYDRNIYTWNTDSVIGLPIDHAMSSMDIKVERTPELTSDHAGLVVEVSEG